MARFPIWTWLLVVVILGGGAVVLMPRAIEKFSDYAVAPKVTTCPDGTRSRDGTCLLEF
jgi:hypothetical protein